MFVTTTLAEAPVVTAPDGSTVRVLAAVTGGGMAHFELAAGETSVAVRHRTVEELWYVLSGRGELWRSAGREVSADGEVVQVVAGTCLSIPVGTSFQFRAAADGPLGVLGVTIPPWPGPGEAERVDGLWTPTLPPGPH